MPIELVKKRNGAVVSFDRTRIEDAIRKACAATGTQVSPDFIGLLTNDITAVLDARFPSRVPGIEDIQDIVEHKLASIGLFHVSKAYILYRREREKERRAKQSELLKRVEQGDLKVAKRDGHVAGFDIREVEVAVEKCTAGIDYPFDVKAIVEESKTAFYDGISTREINQAVLMAIRARIERDPAYASLAARFLINDLYKDVLGMDEAHAAFAAEHERRFPEAIRAGVEAGRLDARLLEFDLARLSKQLDPKRDRLFGYLGAQVLYDRYFLKDLTQRIMEVPQHFWMRIAMGLALGEPRKNEWAIEFYDVMSALRYLPSTPTLFHSGTVRPQMSSCYLTTVEDDLNHIFKCVNDNAQLSKWSGGLGNDWTNIRGTGAHIESTNVSSQGVIPFLKIVDSATAAINRSGKRRGATCVYLETWHYDIEEFLELRRNTGDDRRRTHDINTANWIPDLFMKRVMNDGEWTLFSPDETPDLHGLYGRKFEERYELYEERARRGKIRLFRVVRAKDLWRKMVTQLFETGHPWMTFKDPCNVRSPQDHVGVVHSSNLCTEITLNTSAEETAVCNLGSVNLARHVKDGELDRDLVAATVRYAMRMLDNVVDLNFYPTPEARTSNLRHRPVGLGVMGLQDALYQLGLSFDSREAVRFSDETQEFISYWAVFSSSELAKEKGVYPTYKGSKWDRGIFPLDTVRLLEHERGLPTGVELDEKLDWTSVREHVRRHGMRNSNCMAIAPTATIANIAGCFPSIEPIYKNLYVKSNFSGEFTVVNAYLIGELKARGLWDQPMRDLLKFHDGSIGKIPEVPAELRDRYKETFEIDPYWFIEHAAARGKWIDQSQSVNFFTATTSGRVISDIYLAAWRKGLKTTYYLRTLGASAIEKSTLAVAAHRAGAPAAVAEEMIEHVAATEGGVPLGSPEGVSGARERGGPAVDTAVLAKAGEEIPVKVLADGSVCNLGEDCEACQ